MTKNDKNLLNKKVTYVLNKKTMNDFLLDKISINISSNFIIRTSVCESIRSKYSVVPKNADKHFKRIKLKTIQGGIIFSTTMSFNFYRKARRFLKRKYIIPRTGTLVANNNNFIPILYKLKMQEHGLKYEDLRDELYDSFWKKLDNYLKEFRLTIQPLIINQNQHVDVYISTSHISIALDLKLRDGVHFLKSDNVREKLNSVSSDCNPIIFKDDKSNTMIETKSVREFIEPKRRGLKGTIDKDGSVVMCYLKEESKHGDQVRIEKRMDKIIINDLLKTTRFKNKEDLKLKIDQLGYEWCELIHNTLQSKDKNRKESQKMIFKKLCRQLFPREYYRVFKILYFPPYTLCTGQESICPTSVFRKVRLLAGENKLFKKKCHTYYEIDFNWLDKYVRGETEL